MLSVIATDLPRLMACNGSRLMVASLPTVNAADATKDEGNAVHWLVAQLHRGYVRPAKIIIGQQSPEGVFITEEMLEHVDEYLTAVGDGEVEVDTSHGEKNWSIRGRADAIVYEPAGGILNIHELKYGWRLVEPVLNWTMISHAIGFTLRNPSKKVHAINFVIHQPRPHHPIGRVRTWSIGKGDLIELHNELSLTLSNPSDVVQTSDNCHYCPALATCPAQGNSDNYR